MFKQIALTAALTAAVLSADAGNVPMMTKGLEIDENINRSIDLNLSFLAEDGTEHKLAEYFGKGRPVILNLVYYSCPSLCNMILNGMVQGMKDLPWTPGEQYEVVTISIDPREGPADAAAKRASYVEKGLQRPAPGWHFLVDKNNHVKTLANQIGFKYRFDEAKKQYAHAAAIMVLTADGKLARYLYGTRFTAFNLKMAVTEAQEGKTRFSVEKALLKICYQYDPKAKSYVVMAENLMRLGALVSVTVLGAMLWRFWSWEKQRIDEKRASDPGFDK